MTASHFQASGFRLQTSECRLQPVITGLGLVLPCGDGLQAARASWASQEACFTELPENLGQGRGAVCTQFKSAGIIPPMVSRRLDRPSRFAWVAAHQAFQDAGLNPQIMEDRVAVAVGTLTGGQEASEAFMRPYFAKGPEGASPMLFPNCVAVAASGHLATAFGIKGPSITQLGREASFFAALDQAAYWLHVGMVEVVLLVGSDGLFPLQLELLQRSRLSTRKGLPEVGSRRGFLPGEGAQAFVLETGEHAKARGAKVHATIRKFSNCAPVDSRAPSRTQALKELAEPLAAQGLDAWIAGSNGHPILDDVEAPLIVDHPEWPRPRFPKTLWGEFCGSGGQLLAAALLEPGRRILITAPASGGGQYATLVHNAEERHG